jgi:hypothetical protein
VNKDQFKSSAQQVLSTLGAAPSSTNKRQTRRFGANSLMDHSEIGHSRAASNESRQQPDIFNLMDTNLQKSNLSLYPASKLEPSPLKFGVSSDMLVIPPKELPYSITEVLTLTVDSEGILKAMDIVGSLSVTKNYSVQEDCPEKISFPENMIVENTEFSEISGAEGNQLSLSSSSLKKAPVTNRTIAKFLPHFEKEQVFSNLHLKLVTKSKIQNGILQLGLILEPRISETSNLIDISIMVQTHPDASEVFSKPPTQWNQESKSLEWSIKKFNPQNIKFLAQWKTSDVSLKIIPIKLKYTAKDKLLTHSEIESSLKLPIDTNAEKTSIVETNLDLKV